MNKVSFHCKYTNEMSSIRQYLQEMPLFDLVDKGEGEGKDSNEKKKSDSKKKKDDDDDDDESDDKGSNKVSLIVLDIMYLH